MSEILNEEPLIWTIKGNIPIAFLEYKTEWIDNEDYMLFSESYLLDGETVKSSSHVYNKKGLDMNAVNSQL